MGVIEDDVEPSYSFVTPVLVMVGVNVFAVMAADTVLLDESNE